MVGWGTRAGLAALAICSALVAAGRARADEAEPIKLEFSSHGDACGTEAGFRAQVMARTARARLVVDGATRVFRVTIEGNPPTGKLVVIDAKGNKAERKLGSAPCAELVEALALVTAIAIDPGASTKPIAELAPPFEAIPSNRPGPFVLGPLVPPPVPTRDKVPPSPSPTAWRAIVLAHAGVLAGPLPSAIGHFGGGVGVLREAGFLSQELRFTAAGATTAVASVGAVAASFATVRLDLSVAPVHVLTRWVRVAPVAGFGLLHVDVTPTGVADPQATGRWIPLVGLGARGSLELSPAFVEVEARLAIPLTHERYYIDPSVTVFEAARVAFDGSISVGVRFP